MPKSKTILLVDDQASMRDSLSRILQEEGYTVYTAEDPAHALQRWDQHGDEIDLILTDRVMNRNENAGFNLIQDLRRKDAVCPIVMQSDCDRMDVPGFQGRCREMGGTNCSFTQKISSITAFLNMVERQFSARAKA